jgi:hypothetical protein
MAEFCVSLDWCNDDTLTVIRYWRRCDPGANWASSGAAYNHFVVASTVNRSNTAACDAITTTRSSYNNDTKGNKKLCQIASLLNASYHVVFSINLIGIMLEALASWFCCCFSMRYLFFFGAILLKGVGFLLMSTWFFPAVLIDKYVVRQWKGQRFRSGSTSSNVCNSGFQNQRNMKRRGGKLVSIKDHFVTCQSDGCMHRKRSQSWNVVHEYIKRCKYLFVLLNTM